jgi:hydrogenase maturation protein HypF
VTTRAQILVRGIVQGVGFRPFVYSNASRNALTGRVRNNASGVLIDVEGNSADIEQFVREIEANPPPLSLIESIECRDNLDPVDYADFLILESASEGEKLLPVSADVATCSDCLQELFDVHDRRHRYPFINCTNCGPRFTIIEDVPYDRQKTTMRNFEMCAACRAEYENPLDRRFHAEPTACPDCGPQLSLRDGFGREVQGIGDAVSATRDLLLEGKIVAIKGIGGFHLACDALSAEAVKQLRSRKFRQDKPFALMAASVEVTRKFCEVSDAEAQLLRSAPRPIVLLAQKPDTGIPPLVSPKLNTLGFMLPYTPLHHLLLENFDRPVVMTSGNVSDEPICYEDDEADDRLKGIADYFLFHDREIHIRTDDSVVRVCDEHQLIVRRSRGYAPAPIKTTFDFSHSILACGAELKNTFCLARGHHAFISHHIGDLENFETIKSFTQGIQHYKRLFDIEPEVIAYDLHPEYLSTKYALELDDVTTKIGVQHHHAHIASCMADNAIDGEVIGVAMDGLGFGLDGKMWGGEFLVADFVQAERISHLAYVPLPGGAKAIREPWRMAAVYLQHTFGDDFLNLDLPFVRDLDGRSWAMLRSMMAAGVNSPQTSSMGRLFDAIAALLSVRKSINYEGQAAIELEAMADHGARGNYEFTVSADGAEIKSDAMIRGVVADLLAEVSPAQISGKFHLGVARLILSVAQMIRERRKLNRVVLSGGVFQNTFLLEQVCRLLRKTRFEVFTHARVPSNDGGISLGQAAVANARLKSGRFG